MRTTISHSLTIVALLCLAVTASAQTTSDTDEIFRMFFRYGFDNGKIGDPDGQPTEADVKGLMCATNEFLTNSLQNYTKSDVVNVNAVQINWSYEDFIYNGSEPEAPRNVPVIVNFTAQITTADYSTPPTNQMLWEATKYFDYISYIQDYIWKIPNQNFFTEARGLWYEPFIQGPVTGQLADNDQCPAPAAQRATTLAPVTAYPSAAPIATQRATTLPPVTEYPSAAPSFAQRATTLPPVTATPTEAPVGRNTILTLAPTRKEDEMVYFTIQIDFFAGQEKEPTDEEVKAMMCKTNEFFRKTLRDSIDPSIQVEATNINWEWDDKAALPSVVEFFADAEYADGRHVPAEEVFNVMEKVDVKQFVQDYVWMSEVYKENVYYQTEDIFFAGSYTGSPNPPEPHPGKIQSFGC